MRWIFLVLASVFSLNAAAAKLHEIGNDDSDYEYEEEFTHEKWGDLEEIISESGEKEFSALEEEESLPVEIDQALARDEQEISLKSPLDPLKEKTRSTTQSIQVNFREVLRGSPTIYILLLVLSITSICIWLYSMLTVRSIELLPPQLIKDLREKLVNKQFNDALELCARERHFFCKMLASGILVRNHGLNMMTETMRAEGKRATISFWQRISLLNDIAVIAPMLGLLGTVLGMFYAFYDLNRSVESVSLLFDGLGIAVGTTVAGLIVAIVAMILHSLSKYRLVRVLTSVENEVHTFASLIDTKAAVHNLENLE